MRADGRERDRAASIFQNHVDQTRFGDPELSVLRRSFSIRGNPFQKPQIVRVFGTRGLPLVLNQFFQAQHVEWDRPVPIWNGELQFRAPRFVEADTIDSVEQINPVGRPSELNNVSRLGGIGGYPAIL